MTNPAAIISWSAQLATGLPRVDAEHRRLIELINELGAQHQRGAAAEQLRVCLGELRRYSIYHFQTEAELMHSHAVNAANRRAHLAAHQGFVELLERVEAQVITDPAAVVEHLLAFMVKWLVHHVTGVDARMAREIIALESGVAAGESVLEEGGLYKGLIDTVSELYDSMGARTFELLQTNSRLRAEIERRRRAEEELRLAAIVYSTVDEAVMVTGADNLIVAVNPSFSRITGYAADEVIGHNPSMLSGGINPPEFYQELWGSLERYGKWQGEIRNRRKSGEFFVEWLSINRVSDETAAKETVGGTAAIGAVTHHVGVFSDITNHRAEVDRIQRLAHYDLLTSLPNRVLFSDRVAQALARARRDGTELALMFLDLDLFKQINDTLGHAVGDLLLKEAAVRMQACLRASDTVARMGGDEFVLLLPEVDGAANAMAIAQKIRHALNQPFELAGHSLSVSCSIGIAIHPKDGEDENKLLANADSAMYRAKQGGRNRVELFRQEAAQTPGLEPAIHG